jgi:hypothetical protein
MNDELRDRRDAAEIMVQRASLESCEALARVHEEHDKSIADARSPDEQIKALEAALAIERVITELQRKLLQQDRAQEAASMRHTWTLESMIAELETLCRSHDIDLPWVAGEAPRLN